MHKKQSQKMKKLRYNYALAKELLENEKPPEEQNRTDQRIKKIEKDQKDQEKDQDGDQENKDQKILKRKEMKEMSQTIKAIQ